MMEHICCSCNKTIFISFVLCLFCTYRSVFKIEYCGRLGVRWWGAGVRVKFKNYQRQLLFCNGPVPPAITPNHGPMNRLL